jgi:deoxyribodipyrimidine photo-lyase
MAIEPERLRQLNDRPVCNGRWVLYWMQQSQRAHDNPALEYAISRANRLNLPVLVAFALTDSYPDANRRHYRFMLEGLADTRRLLARRRIGMVIRHGEPPAILEELLDQAALLVCDVGYTRHQRAWRTMLAQIAACRTVAIEGDVVVPVGTVSTKAEYAARTIRPKIHRHLDRFLVACPRYRPRHDSVDHGLGGLDLDDIDAVLDRLHIDASVRGVTAYFRGGPTRAKQRLRRFLGNGLATYRQDRSQPRIGAVSCLSPYLHFGQISPVYMALRVADTPGISPDDRDAYLEELIVRRELAVNFVAYTSDYDHYRCLPAWARKTLAEHAADRRPTRYDTPALIAGRTHDPYWNAAMAEMRDTGFMHNTMRMYWGKKILEWSKSPEEAYATTLALNNRFFLDGRDPNSFAGVGWIFGLHDRAWFEREIFGKVRYMAASGLERKYAMQAYLDQAAALPPTGEPPAIDS